MPARFFLVRHGQSEYNAQGRWQGRSDPPLSAHGRDEAKRAAHRLASFSGVIVSSPLRRAFETAEIIAARLGIGPIVVVTGLQEVDTGAWSGLTSAQIEERFPDEWVALREGRHTGWPGGETRAGFRERVLAVLGDLHRRYAAGDVLALTHGGPIAVLERELDIHPGFGVGNLVGRWFELDPLRSRSDRIALADDSDRP